MAEFAPNFTVVFWLKPLPTIVKLVLPSLDATDGVIENISNLGSGGVDGIDIVLPVYNASPTIYSISLKNAGEYPDGETLIDPQTTGKELVPPKSALMFVGDPCVRAPNDNVLLGGEYLYDVDIFPLKYAAQLLLLSL